jgi:hypothetical protein
MLCRLIVHKWALKQVSYHFQRLLRNAKVSHLQQCPVSQQASHFNAVVGHTLTWHPQQLVCPGHRVRRRSSSKQSMRQSYVRRPGDTMPVFQCLSLLGRPAGAIIGAQLDARFIACDFGHGSRIRWGEAAAKMSAMMGTAWSERECQVRA